MAYVFKQHLISEALYKQKATYSMTPQYITVHNTANDALAVNEMSYMRNNNLQTSFHLAVDDKEVIQAIPFNRNAWHCGDGSNGTGNRKSIGIEICYSKSGGKRYDEAEENAVQYIAKLLNDLGWGIDRVKQHFEWSGKNCPHRIRDEKRWSSFIARIEKAMKPSTVKEEVVKVSESIAQQTFQIEAIKEIKAAVKDGRFTSKHEDVEKYSDADLQSYMMIALARRK